MNKQTSVQPKRKTAPRRVQAEPIATKQGLGDEHPLNDIIGTHEGEVWEDILKNIKRNRKEVDRLYWA